MICCYRYPAHGNLRRPPAWVHLACWPEGDDRDVRVVPPEDLEGIACLFCQQPMLPRREEDCPREGMKMTTTTYQIDRAMLGPADFHGSLERVAELLREQGYDVQAVTGSHNGADNEHYDGPEIPAGVFGEAVLTADIEGWEVEITSRIPEPL